MSRWGIINLDTPQIFVNGEAYTREEFQKLLRDWVLSGHMSQNQTDKPRLEILFDPADVNTHQPAATYNDVPVHVEKDGGSALEKVQILRKYLKVVVHNSGSYAAENCIAKARVLILDADKNNDNQLRYPSTEQKLLMWDPIDKQVSPITSVNVDEDERLYVAFADSGYLGIPIINCPARFASLATRGPIETVGGDGIVVQDSFFTGDFDIEISVTCKNGPSVKKIVRIHVDQNPIATSILSVGDAAWSSDHSVGNEPANTPSSGSIA